MSRQRLDLVETLRRAGTAQHVTEDLLKFLDAIDELGRDQARSQSAGTRALIAETAPLLDTARVSLNAYVDETASFAGKQWYGDEWYRVCARRSQIEFVRELYLGFPPVMFDEMFMDTEELDRFMRIRGAKEGSLEPNRIPPNTPKSHWWWWCRITGQNDDARSRGADSMRSIVDVLRRAAEADSVTEDLMKFIGAVEDLARDPRRRASPEGQAFLVETAALIPDARVSFDAYIERAASYGRQEWYGDDWYRICDIRSKIEFVRELYRDLVPVDWGIWFMDTDDLDHVIRAKGKYEGSLDASRIPPNTPKTHWWWWCQITG